MMLNNYYSFGTFFFDSPSSGRSVDIVLEILGIVVAKEQILLSSILTSLAA